jgi:serine protease AprX
MKNLITILGALAAAGNLFANPKIAKDLQNAAANPAAKIIVQFNRPPSQSQLDLLKTLGGLLGLNLDLGLINALVYTISSDAIAVLANNPDVKYISPDRPIKGSLEFANPTVTADLAFKSGYTGSGGLLGGLLGNSTVAIIDSGVTDHPDLHGLLLSRVVYSQSFIPGDSSTGDAYGHGTHVAGIVAGNASQSSGNSIHSFRGIAPVAGIVNLRVLDANGSGSDSSVIAAISRAIALKSQYNIRVINLSLGRPVRESYLLDPLCRRLSRRGKRESSWWLRRVMRAGITPPARMAMGQSLLPGMILM